MEDLLNMFYAVMTMLMLVMVYFAPALIAYENKKRNNGAIFAMNLLLGWTFLGWVIALVWALTKDAPQVVQPARPTDPSQLTETS